MKGIGAVASCAVPRTPSFSLPAGEADEWKPNHGGPPSVVNDYLDKAAKFMTIILTALMIMVVGVNVFCRYVLGFSFGWGEELPRYCLVWIAFTGGI